MLRIDGKGSKPSNGNKLIRRSKKIKYFFFILKML